MKRCLFNGLAAVTLLLCLVTAYLWMRSRYVRDTWIVGYVGLNRVDAQNMTESRGFSLVSEFGEISITTFHLRHSFVSQQRPSGYRYLHSTGIPTSRGLCFGFDRLPQNPVTAGDIYRGVQIMRPDWFAMLPGIGVAAGLILRQRRLRKIRMIGHCRVCGYDLRATPERCPECGTVVAKSANDAARIRAG